MEFSPEDADGLAHVLGSGGAVEANDVNTHAFEDGEGSGYIGAQQHPTGRIEGDLGLQRQIDLCLFEGLVYTCNGSLDFEDILRGFDQQHIHAAADQADSLLAEDFGQLVEGDIRKVGVVSGGQFAGRTDGPGHKTRLLCFCLKFIRESTRQGRGGLVDLDHAFTQFVFRHRDAVGAEGVGLEHVHTHFEERAVDLFHCLGI